jgi:ATP-binding cassette, subfamily B, bacterial
VKDWSRGFRVLIAFGFRAAPREAALFLGCGGLMALGGPIGSLGMKLLVDAATRGSLRQGLVAALLLALLMGGELVVVLYYIDLLFTVAERAGAMADKRLMALLGGTPGLAHHELPQYLDELDLLRQERGRLAWMTNVTSGLLRVVVQVVASELLLARVQPLLLLLPLFGVISFFASKRAAELQTHAREQTAELERLRRHLFSIATSAEAGKELRVFDLSGELLRRHREVARALFRVRHRADWQGAALRAVDALAFGGGYVGAIGVVLLRALHGQATPGDVVLTVGLAAGLNSVVSSAVAYGTNFLALLRTARRYLWLEDYARSAQRAPADPAPVPATLTRGVTLRDVSFGYPGTARPVLTDVSLTLPAGGVVALVGENGAGKSTLVKLLCGFYEPSSGSVLADGIDLRRFAIADWRRRVSAAFQDFSRFEFLVRETIGVGDLPHIEEREAVQVALARAGADDIPPALPAGLETQLGKAWPEGVDLSGGQWQKLALGRGLMRPDPLLLIFDEPTAALDAPTEHALFERFAAAARRGEHAGTVTVLVSHRFSTVRMADLIVVLDGGRIVEHGSHQELLQRAGLYAELYRLQSRAYA